MLDKPKLLTLPYQRSAQNRLLFSEVKSRTFPKIIIILFLLLVAYTAIPIIDVPLMGLSLSAPVFYVITLAVFLRPPERWFAQYQGWLLLAATLWGGILISALGNGLFSGGTVINGDVIITVIRFAYWVLVFVVTTYFVSRAQLGPRIANVLAFSVLVLALLRWGEAILYGSIGAWAKLYVISQNSYGLLFSTYMPFVLLLIFDKSGRRRFWGLLATLVVLGAAAINGSRGSWFSLTVGIVVFVLLYARIRPQHSHKLILILVLVGISLGILQYAPEQFTAPLMQRFETLDSLESDKSYMIRQLMIQKGWRLFQESPVIGVGPGRFTQASVPLDLPLILKYAPQSHFDVKSAHNSYLAFLAEMGLAAVLPYSLLILILLVRGYQGAVFLGQRDQLWGAAIYLSFLTMSVHMWAISSLTSTSPWLSYGLVASLIVTAQQYKSSIASTIFSESSTK